MFLLDCKNRIISVNQVSIDTLTHTVVHPREVFKAAILANCASIIIAHNHPSDELTPSREDIEMTGRLKEAGDILGIRVLDHVVVDTETGDFASFVEKGLL